MKKIIRNSSVRKTLLLIIMTICVSFLVSCGETDATTASTNTNTNTAQTETTSEPSLDTPTFDIEFKDVEDMTDDEIIAEIETMAQEVADLEDELAEIIALQEELEALEAELAELEALENEILALENELETME